MVMKLIKLALVVLLLFAFADAAGALCTSVIQDGSTARVYNGATQVGSKYIGSLLAVDYGGAYALGQSASEVCVFSCTTNAWSCSTFSGIASLHKGSDYLGVLYNSNLRVKVWTLADNAWGTEQSFTGGVTGGSSGVYLKEGYLAVLYNSSGKMKIWDSATNTWGAEQSFTGGATSGNGGVYAGTGYIGVLYDGGTDMTIWTLASKAWGSATAFSGPANGVYAGEGYIGVMYDGSTDMNIWTLAANAWGSATTFSGPATIVAPSEGYIGVIYDSGTDAKVWTLAANAWGSTASFTGGVSNTYAGRGYFGVMYDSGKRMKIWSSPPNSWNAEKYFSGPAIEMYAGEGYIGVLYDNGTDITIWKKSTNSWGSDNSFSVSGSSGVYAGEGYIGVLYEDGWDMDVWSLASGTWESPPNFTGGTNEVYTGSEYIGVLYNNSTYMRVWELGDGWESDHLIQGGANTVTLGLGHIGVLHNNSGEVDVWARGSGWGWGSSTYLIGTGDNLISCGPHLAVRHDSATDVKTWTLSEGTWASSKNFVGGVYNMFASGDSLYVLSDYESGSPPVFPRWNLDIGNMSTESWTDMYHYSNTDQICHGTPSTCCNPLSCPSGTCYCSGGTYTTCEGDKIYRFDYCSSAKTLVKQCKPSTACTNTCSAGGSIECSADNTKQRVCGIYMAAGETCAETSETTAECQAQQPCLGWGAYEDCGAGKVCVSGSGCVPQPACAVTSASPATVATGDSTTVSISYSNFSAKPTTGTFACGNGATAGALTCTGTTTGTCTVACSNYTTVGTFSATATVNNGASPVSCTGSAAVTVTTAPVASATAQTPINAGALSLVTVTYSGFSGGTPTAATSTLGCGGGGASVSVPLSCTAGATPGNGTCTFTCGPYSPAGTYTISVTLSNGTGAGKQSASGSDSVTVSAVASCGIESATPTSIAVDGSSTISINYSNFSAIPTLSGINCGTGSGATGSGLNCNAGTCTLSCGTYSTAGSYTVDSLVLNDGMTTRNCTGSAAVTVTTMPAISAIAETPIPLDDSSIVTATYVNFTAGDAPTLAESTIGCGSVGATVSGFSCADNGDGTGTCTFTCGAYAAEGTYTVSITLGNGIESPSTTIDVDVGGLACGNGTIDAGEVCDGAAPITVACTDFGFSGGTLACTASCTFDTSGCTGLPPLPVCGNGVKEGSEECDGAAPVGETCATQGFDSGTIGCTLTCEFDLSDCSNIAPPPAGGEPKLRIFSANTVPVSATPGSTDAKVSVIVKNSGTPTTGRIETSAPEGIVVAQFDPASFDSGLNDAELSVSVPAGIKKGNYPIGITLYDESGAVADTATAYLNVSPATEAVAVPEVPPAFAALAALGVLLILWRRK